ncbi:SLC13 family permease [Rhodobacter ferrooxidans]|uniref:Citrate transporter n=1 Tax=Rhodobacter ferrooxidans TaxID=371731 RepID=C8S3H7_9RHOB|nr:SLC13 family permease [Rhodobacter sp. SW2]EEW24425.1 Citrate transporter [Rhodobacter sp. SW2]
MFGLELAQTTQAWVAVAILVGMFVMFLRETYPVEVVAIGASGLMLVLGIIPANAITGVLANNAPWTIAAMFIIVGGLVRTGALEYISGVAARNAAIHPARTLILLGLMVTGMSAFVNNTPLVVVMMPIFMQLSKQLAISPSKLLIPLSYMTILGGTVTLVGTSTNLVVDGVAQAKGLAPFTIFEMTPIGIVVALTGLVYLGLGAKRLLPDRDSMSSLLSDRSKMKFFTEVAVPEDSALIGKRLDGIDIFRREGARVIDVLRGDASLRRGVMADVVLEAGDRVVLRTAMSEVLGLQTHKDLRMVEKLSSVETSTVEVLISPGCRMVGRTLREMRLRRRYGVYPLAVHRRNMNTGQQMDDLEVQVGDTLLLEGAMADIRRLAEDMELVDVAHPSERAYRRHLAPIVIAVLLAVVGLSALNVASIQVLAFIGVGVVLATRCIDADEAFGFVDGRLMGMLFGMLGVGAGLEHSGAVEMLVGWVSPYMQGISPYVLVFLVYLLTSFLTEVVSNNAVAVIVTPVVIGLAQSLGVDPRPLVMVVMIGASASFATPIGYQTNTLVFGPGGYKFADFIRFGVPLNLICLVVVTIAMPLLYEF